MEPVAALAVGYQNTSVDAITKASTRAQEVVTYVK
ncbi:hypothetical protein Pmgp_02140 [Pelotomaculum propionicicum]|uniref:Uncharacterized protein n=1 Tax=Pelotomaculum propionicicum TaxID=258475 RepID=A0A4Y7RPQ8_9FIRM|nr:hypothetical protein Pmgp_02140 [Pelotomaculum propionicicum]